MLCWCLTDLGFTGVVLGVPDTATAWGVHREQFCASTGTSVECWEEKKMCYGEIGGLFTHAGMV